jgi:hypothetical protein
MSQRILYTYQQSSEANVYAFYSFISGRLTDEFSILMGQTRNSS